jgi:hypothetical protein
MTPSKTAVDVTNLYMMNRTVKRRKSGAKNSLSGKEGSAKRSFLRAAQTTNIGTGTATHQTKTIIVQTGSRKMPTWFQVYETVSEGTPVTPPFATKEELVDYLVANGDFWDQHRGDGGWSRENAEAFVGAGFAMSLVVNTATGTIKAPRDGQFTE